MECDSGIYDYEEENLCSDDTAQEYGYKESYTSIVNEGKHLRLFSNNNPMADYSDSDKIEDVTDDQFGVNIESQINDEYSDALSLDDAHNYQTLNPLSSHEVKSSASALFQVEDESTESINYNLDVNINNELRSVFEISQRYRHIFAGYPCFNPLQSQAFDIMLYTDKPVVVAAPTGAGKTVLFEMAIVRLLQTLENYKGDFKMVYMAPVKALCSERYLDWNVKFGPLGVRCLELTGDSDPGDYFELRDFQLLLTTPEKWDVVTRRWRDNRSLVQLVKLFLIDEVHLLSEEHRGPVMEAVVSRMKTVQQALEQHLAYPAGLPQGMRFVAVSATVPNLEDVSAWLSSEGTPAVQFRMDEDQRPVPLKKVVLGFPCQQNWSPFRFDLSLTYKLKQVIFSYSENKSTLVFCSTRKAVQQTTMVLTKDITFKLNAEKKEYLHRNAQQIRDTKIRESVLRGVGSHHAGMDAQDRHIIEELFRTSALPVLVATSTLAMGVNLPAHLVVIKSTEQYVGGVYQEYSESALLQMMGRAGRPQFDTSATAVIMTRSDMKAKYERFLQGRKLVESSLHRHLPEHLNAEVVLNTITDIDVALTWVRSTFLYVRALRCPREYGLVLPQPVEQPSTQRIEQKLQELCMRELNALASCEMVELHGLSVKSTGVGRLMARYYMALESMKIFMQLTGDETMAELLTSMSRCDEFSEIQLRVNERRPLNVLNRCRGREVVRFPLPGKIMSRDKKVNVLVQAALGTLPIPDPSLHQETIKIMRIAQRLTKCLSEFLLVKRPHAYRAALNAARLVKAVHCRMWHDSPFLCRQLPRIGPALATLLASAGKNSFNSIQDANPRDLERIIGRAAPLGNILQAAVARLPRYSLELQAKRVCNDIKITVEFGLENVDELQKDTPTAGQRHAVILLLAERTSNSLLHRERVADAFLLRTRSYMYTTQLKVEAEQSVEIIVHCISETWVGLDIERLVKIGIVEKEISSERVTPRLVAATPRALRHKLHTFVKAHVAKAKIAPASSISTKEALLNSTASKVQSKGGLPTAGCKGSSTPVAADTPPPSAARGSGSLYSEQLHTKYGHLIGVRVTRPLSTLVAQQQLKSANEGGESTEAKLPALCDAAKTHDSWDNWSPMDIDELDYDTSTEDQIMLSLPSPSCNSTNAFQNTVNKEMNCEQLTQPKQPRNTISHKRRRELSPDLDLDYETNTDENTSTQLKQMNENSSMANSHCESAYNSYLNFDLNTDWLSSELKVPAPNKRVSPKSSVAIYLSINKQPMELPNPSHGQATKRPYPVSSDPVLTYDAATRNDELTEQTRSPINKRPRLESPVPVLDFDLGIEEILNSEPELPPPRHTQKVENVVSPTRTNKVPVQRTLSPPRDPEELRQLVVAVLGSSIQSGAGPRDVFLEPQEAERAPLERQSPMNYLTATLQGHTDIPWTLLGNLNI